MGSKTLENNKYTYLKVDGLPKDLVTDHVMAIFANSFWVIC